MGNDSRMRVAEGDFDIVELELEFQISFWRRRGTSQFMSAKRFMGSRLPMFMPLSRVLV